MNSFDMTGLAKLDFASLDYMRAHLDFRENRTNQNTQIAAALTDELRRLRPQNRPFRIASIGAGTGILDTPIIEALLKDGPIEFLAIEPNPHELNDLKKRFEQFDPAQLSLSTHAGLIEGYQGGSGYDVVMGVHISYYSQDIRPMILAACDLASNQDTGNQGHVIFVVSTDMPGNRLFVDTTEHLHGYRPPLDAAFRATVQSLNIPLEHKLINAEIDLTEVFADQTQKKLKIFLDFYLHANTKDLSTATIQAYVDHLKGLCIENDKKSFLPHNATLVNLKRQAS